MRTVIHEATRTMVGLLVERRYQELERITQGVRLTAQESQAAIEHYGATLVFPPEDGIEQIDVVEVSSPQQSAWSVSCPLWTKEEGRSALSIELTIILTPTGTKVEIDNVRVR